MPHKKADVNDIGFFFWPGTALCREGHGRPRAALSEHIDVKKCRPEKDIVCREGHGRPRATFGQGWPYCRLFIFLRFGTMAARAKGSAKRLSQYLSLLIRVAESEFGLFRFET